MTNLENLLLILFQALGVPFEIQLLCKYDASFPISRRTAGHQAIHNLFQRYEISVENQRLGYYNGYLKSNTQM